MKAEPATHIGGRAVTWANGLAEAVERLREHSPPGVAARRFDARDREALAYVLCRVAMLETELAHERARVAELEAAIMRYLFGSDPSLEPLRDVMKPRPATTSTSAESTEK